MQDNFDIHEWNRNNALKEIQEDKSSTDVIYNRLLSYFEKNKDDGERFKHAYEIFKEYGNYIKMEIIRSNMFEDSNTESKNLNSIKETITTIMENPEGFSKYFPGGKTQGLTTDELSTILMKIVKDIEEDGKELDENTLTEDDRCTKIAKRKYDSWPSAYASGAVVRCRKGDIWKGIKG